MARANFAVLAGDGTGPEIIGEAVKVLGALRDRTARTWRPPSMGYAVAHEVRRQHDSPRP